MGIETATLLAAVGAGASVLGAMASKKSQPTEVAAPEAPPATQESKTPDTAALKQKNAATALTGPMAGAGSTLLTGSSGIADSTLNLGKNSKLGQ